MPKGTVFAETVTFEFCICEFARNYVCLCNVLSLLTGDLFFVYFQLQGAVCLINVFTALCTGGILLCFVRISV